MISGDWGYLPANIEKENSSGKNRHPDLFRIGEN